MPARHLQASPFQKLLAQPSVVAEPACSVVAVPACCAVAVPACSVVALPACCVVAMPACSAVPACSVVSVPAYSVVHHGARPLHITAHAHSVHVACLQKAGLEVTSPGGVAPTHAGMCACALTPAHQCAYPITRLRLHTRVLAGPHDLCFPACMCSCVSHHIHRCSCDLIACSRALHHTHRCCHDLMAAKCGALVSHCWKLMSPGHTLEVLQMMQVGWLCDRACCSEHGQEQHAASSPQCGSEGQSIMPWREGFLADETRPAQVQPAEQ